MPPLPVSWFRALWLALLLWCCCGQAGAAACRVEASLPVHVPDCIRPVSDTELASALGPAFAGTAQGFGQWFQIDVLAAPGKRVLDLGIPDAFELKVLQRDTRGLRTLLALDRQSPFSARSLQNRSLAVPVQFESGATSLFVYYETHGKTPLFARLLTESQFAASDTMSNVGNGLIFGFMLAMIPLLTLGLGTQQSRSYRIYAGLVLTSLMFIAQIEGYSFQFLWPDHPGWNMRAPAFLGVAAIVCHVAFAVTFLQMKLRMPRLYRCHWVVLAFTGLILLVQLARFDKSVDVMLFGLTLVYSWLAAFSAYQGVRQNIPAARFYLLGTMSEVVFTVLLLAMGLLWFNPFPQLSVLSYPKIGYLGEAMFFAAAVVSQIYQFNEQQAELRVRRLAETEQLLQAEQSKLAALERAKHQQLRLASASHDISQPLASIRFAIAALGAQQDNRPITEHIDNTLNYAQTLLKDLMGQVRQDQQQQGEMISLAIVFAQLQQEFSGLAAQKGLQLSVRACNVTFPGSALLLYRVLNNLLANAVRYTREGRIVVGARRRPGAVEVQIWDTGPGIPKAIQQAMLQPFRQGQDGGAGFGLGLFIVKNLCEQCGYRLNIASLPGRGSAFSITIPLDPPA